MSENIENKAVIKLMISGNYMVEQLNSFMKTYDLTVQQYNILRILRGQKGKPVNLCVLQEHMIHKMSNTTRLVEKLRLKELLERKVCEKNRRKIEIFITDNGLELLKEIDPLLATLEQELTSNLDTAELKQLIKLVEKIKQ